MYDDRTNPPHQARQAHGQRCPGCGNLDPDPLARFCGVCGTAMGHLAAPPASPTGPTAQFPAPTHGYDPPARRAPAPPPMQSYVPGPSPASFGPGPSQAVYAVPSIDLVGAGQIGAAISAVFNLIPCLLFAWGCTSLVSGTRWVLDALTTASIRVPVPLASIDVPVNYIDLFRLRPFYNFMVYWDDRLWLVFALLFLVTWVVSIIGGALYGGTLAAVYTMVGKASGGMRVTLVPTQSAPLGQPSPPAAWQPGPPAGAPPAWPNQGWPTEPRR
ncbi:MAG TPA: hypothetical protein VFH48_04560 [Chloroflexota bacterium]|nr:hypothetical protein [Chloroflexota bacterium]